MNTIKFILTICAIIIFNSTPLLFAQTYQFPSYNQGPSLDTMYKTYERKDFYPEGYKDNLNNAYNPQNIFDREHDKNIESLKERSSEKMDADSVGKKTKFKDIDSYYNEETGESNTNTDVLNPTQNAFKYNYGVKEKADLINAMVNRVYSGTMSDKNTKEFLDPNEISKMIKALDSIGNEYSKTLCDPSSNSSYLGGIMDFATQMASAVKSGINTMGIQNFANLLNSTMSVDDITQQLQGTLSETELNTLLESIKLAGYGDSIPTMGLFTGIFDTMGTEAAKSAITTLAQQITPDMAEGADQGDMNATMLNAITQSSVPNISPDNLDTFMQILGDAEGNHSQFDQLTQLQNMLNGETSQSDSDDSLFGNIDFADFLGTHECITAAKRFVHDLSDNYVNIWAGYWCPCRSCKICLTPIAQIDIWKQGSLFGDLLGSLGKCASSTKDLYKTNSYVKCVAEAKNHFTDDTVESLIEVFKKRMEREKEAREFTRLDSELNKKSLNYLLYGTDDNETMKKYDSKSIYGNVDIDMLKELDEVKKQRKEDYTGIYLPNGQILKVTNKSLEYSKTDDFVDIDKRTELFSDLIDDFNTNRLPYIVNNNINIADFNKERYNRRIKVASDTVLDYVNNSINKVFCDSNSSDNCQKVYPIKTVVNNCNNLMQDLYTKIGQEKKYYISQAVPKQIDTSFNMKVLDNEFMNDYNFNISLLYTFNEMTYEVCSNYYNRYKKYLADSLSNISGFVNVSPDKEHQEIINNTNVGNTNNENFSGNMWNEELQKIYDRNLEKMQVQMSILDTYEKDIKDLYYKNIELLNAPLQQYTY